MAIESYKMGPGTLKVNVVRTATIATTNTSTTITASAPTFLTGDVGASITGAGIPVGATITAVGSSTSATISAAATATGAAVVATITPTGGVQDISCQMNTSKIVPSEEVDADDDLPMLCGEDLAGDEDVTHTYGFEGTYLQDITASGLIAYSYTNKGKQVACEFVPNTALGRKVTFPLRVVPIEIGGEVKKRPTSDLKWAVPKGFHPVLS